MAGNVLRKEAVGGLRLSTLIFILFAISMALCIGVALEAVNVANRYNTLAEANNLASLCEKAVTQAGKTSDYLTAECRLFATTGDISHARLYFEESEKNRSREHSLQTVRENFDDPAVIGLLEDAMQKSDALMSTEEYSMALILLAQGLVPSEALPELASVSVSPTDAALSSSDQKALAAEMLFNQAYANDKEAIDSEISEVLERVTSSTDQILASESQALERSIQMQQILIGLLVITTIATLLAVIFLVVLPLRTIAKRLEGDERLDVKGGYELRCIAKTYNDIYDFKLENATLLQKRADHDPLTGALNRGAFRKAAEELRTSGKPLCVAIIDVDNFKQVNDNYGHAMGDKALCLVAKLLMSRFRETDIVARIGGDEFAVIAVDLPAANAAIMRLKIESIGERLANPRGDVCPITLSVGCAFSKDSYNSELYEQADQALYAVKEGGRNGIAFYGRGDGQPSAQTERREDPDPGEPGEMAPCFA